MSSEYCYGVRESLKKIDVQLEHFNRIGAHNIQTSDIIYVLADEPYPMHNIFQGNS